MSFLVDEQDVELAVGQNRVAMVVTMADDDAGKRFETVGRQEGPEVAGQRETVGCGDDVVAAPFIMDL